jgi:hypothetical protein
VPPVTQTYQLKITLQNIDPPIWRRVQVPAAVTLGDLHAVLQVAFGWTDAHMHHFLIRKIFYSPPPFDPHLKMADEDEFLLGEVARARSRFLYEYDFGDDWEHRIVVEKVLPFDRTDPQFFRCLAGERACPPEDCGGPWGYAELLEALADPKHARHHDLLDWLGGSFDPEAFDLAATNAALLAIQAPPPAPRKRPAKQRA